MSTTNSSRDSFHGQLAAVIEVLANTAVAEICKLVDDGYAVLRLEISQNQREIDGLRRKLLDAKSQTTKRNHTLDKMSALKHSGSVHVTRGPSAPSRARCNPTSKSSTQGTGREEAGGGFPIILRVESGDGNTLKDVQTPVKQGSETNTRASANTLSSRHIPRTLDQRFNTRHHSNGSRDHPSSDRNNRFTSTTSHADSNLFTSASQWAEAGAAIEVWNNSGSLTTGNCSLNPPHNSVSGNPSNVAPSLAGNLDWEPDMVLVDSVPIKVDAGMSSEWSIIDRDGITRSAKRRLQKHGREEELEAARSAPTLSTETLDGTTGFRSSLVDANSATSYSNLSSFPSLLSAIKTPRQALHPQANRGDNQSSSLNEIAASSAREFSRLLNSIPPMALPAQPTGDAGGQPLRCELCGKTFNKFQNLRLHNRVHMGEKPFSCPICGKCFLQSNHMKRHLSIHT